MNKEQSIDQVQSAQKNYYMEVYSYASKWIKNRKTYFSSEDIIADYNKTNNPKPKEYRVFGAVIRELSKLNLITHYGFDRYKNPAGHSKPINLWISNIISK